MKPIHIFLALAGLTTMPAMSADKAADFKDLTARAENGDTGAQVTLAICYRDGKGVAKDDVLAMQWAHRAADHGNTSAMDFLGHAYIAAENLYILCNPAVASPALQLITADDLKNFWRSDHYGRLSKGVLSRPAFVIAKP